MGGKAIKFDDRYVDFVCENADKMTVPTLTKLANELGYGVHNTPAVSRLIRRKGLTFFKSRHVYTPEQITFIKRNQHIERKRLLINFNEKFNANISDVALNVFCATHKIKAKKHPGQFKKGQNAWVDNDTKLVRKGAFLNPCVATQFKKGQPALNRVPLGHERKDKRGFIEVRVEDGTGTGKYGGGYNYKLKHHIVWESHHKQAIPESHVIVFKDGDKSNFDIDNLMLLPRGAISIRSLTFDYENQPTELKPTINVLAKLIYKTDRA